MLSRSRGQTLAVTALCCAVLVSGCGGGGGKKAASSTQSSTPVESGPTRAGSSQFGDPARGASKFFPLKPGTQWVREGHVDVGHRTVSHRVLSTVTDVSKKVDGVVTVGVLDQDFNGGQVAEQSVDWLAEDKQGNVWDLGSYTESYEGGQFVNASDARLAGVKGSTRSLLMKGDPRVGDQWPATKVIKLDQSQCVPFKCFKGVMIVQEGVGLGELKSFAPGVGQLKAAPRFGGGKREVEDLVNLVRLSPRGLSEMSAVVLKLDRHARGQSPDVFGRAAPAKRTL